MPCLFWKRRDCLEFMIIFYMELFRKKVEGSYNFQRFNIQKRMQLCRNFVRVHLDGTLYLHYVLKTCLVIAIAMLRKFTTILFYKYQHSDRHYASVCPLFLLCYYVIPIASSRPQGLYAQVRLLEWDLTLSVLIET